MFPEVKNDRKNPILNVLSGGQFPMNVMADFDKRVGHFGSPENLGVPVFAHRPHGPAFVLPSGKERVIQVE